MREREKELLPTNGLGGVGVVGGGGLGVVFLVVGGGGGGGGGGWGVTDAAKHPPTPLLIRPAPERTNQDLRNPGSRENRGEVSYWIAKVPIKTRGRTVSGDGPI